MSSRFPTAPQNYNPFGTLQKRDNIKQTNNIQRFNIRRNYHSTGSLSNNKCMDSYNRRYHKMNKRRAKSDNPNYENRPVLKAVCILIVNDKNEFLSVSHKKDFNDKNMPGGKVDWEDKTDIDAAIREMREETGIIIKKEDMKLIYKNFDIGHNQTFLVKTYYASSWEGEIYTEESGKVEWLPLEIMRTDSKHWNVYNGIVLDRYYSMKNK